MPFMVESRLKGVLVEVLSLLKCSCLDSERRILSSIFLDVSFVYGFYFVFTNV